MSDRTRTAVLCAVLALLYAAGLVLMLARHLEAGLLLWLVSTVGGIAVLYALRRTGKDETGEKSDRCE